MPWVSNEEFRSVMFVNNIRYTAEEWAKKLEADRLQRIEEKLDAILAIVSPKPST